MLDMRRVRHAKPLLIRGWNGKTVRIEKAFQRHFIRHGFIKENEKAGGYYFTGKQGFFDELKKEQDKKYGTKTESKH